MAKQRRNQPLQAQAGDANKNDQSGVGTQAATILAIVVGAALIEVELIPGILIGVGAMLAPKVSRA